MHERMTLHQTDRIGPGGSRENDGPKGRPHRAPAACPQPLLLQCDRPRLWLFSPLGDLGQHKPQLGSATEGASLSGPPGLLYLCMKHITDRYNMYYSYAPTKLNGQIHMAAVKQAIFAPLLGLFWMLFFSILRLGRPRPAGHPPSACPAAPSSPPQQLCES